MEHEAYTLEPEPFTSHHKSHTRDRAVPQRSIQMGCADKSARNMRMPNGDQRAYCTRAYIRALFAILGAFSGCLSGQAQSLLNGPGGTPNLQGTDLAVLEARENRKDLPCVVTPQKPALGFDLRFHAGYDITVPLKEIAGEQNLLTVVFRVAQTEKPDFPVYFVQRIHVPSIEDDARGDAFLQGSFDLGVGKYQVDWLMRDRTERVCSSSWEAESALTSKDKGVEVTLEAGEIAPTDKEQFEAEPFLRRPEGENGLNLKVLVNFAPQNAQSATLQESDTDALVSVLRCMQRDPRIGRFSVVAFNVQEEKVLFRQNSEPQIDFPAIGEAVRNLHLGRVDIARLGQKHAGTEFLGDLLVQEFSAPDKPDAYVIAGPKTLMEESIPAEKLGPALDKDLPVFYLNYNLSPQAAPWRDALSGAVRLFKGQEFTISKPRDLWFAITELVGKAVKSKAERRETASAGVGKGL
jgi:hypothetical protein